MERLHHRQPNGRFGPHPVHPKKAQLARGYKFPPRVFPNFIGGTEFGSAITIRC
jgi:hypothetical protein